MTTFTSEQWAMDAETRGLELLLHERPEGLHHYCKMNHDTGEWVRVNQVGSFTAVDTDYQIGDAISQPFSSDQRHCDISPIDVVFIERMESDVRNNPTKRVEYNNVIRSSMMRALGVKADKKLIASITATCQTGKNRSTPITWASAGRTRANTYGGGSTGLNYNKMIEALTELKDDQNDINASTPMVLLVGRQQYKELLLDDKFINSDYNATGVPATSPLVTKNDIRIVPVQTDWLPKPAGDRLIYAFKAGALLCRRPRPVETTKNVLPDKKMGTDIYQALMSLGYTRLEENSFLEIGCAEA